MNKKLILVILLVFALAMTLVACDGIDQSAEEHQHTFSSQWTYDENNHWHAATCEHTDEVDGKAAHNMAEVPVDKTLMQCSDCGYSYTVSHEHTLAKEYAANEQGHWHNTLCGCVYEDLAPHHFVEGICDDCGWWSSASEVLLANLSQSDVFNYAIVLNNVTVYDVNLPELGIENADITLDGELQLTMSANGQIDGYGYFQTADICLKAVVEDGVVYACSDADYIRCELEQLLMQQGVDVKAYIDKLNANTQQIRDYVNQVKQVVEGLDVYGSVADGLLETLVKVDEASSTELLTAYVIDSDVLRQLNLMLSTTTVKDYVNSILNELSGTALGSLLGDDFYELPNKVRSLLKTEIGITLLELRGNNHSLDELLNQINQFIAAYYPDDKVNTIDELLVANGINLGDLASFVGIKLKNVTVKEAIIAVSAFSPETLWNMVQKDDADKISAKQIGDDMTELFNLYGDKTVYDLIAESNDELTAEYVKSLVDAATNLLDECVALTFYVDNDGVLQQITFAVSPTDTVYEQAEIEQLKQLLASAQGTISLNRDYQTEQDYTQIVEQVNAHYECV